MNDRNVRQDRIALAVVIAFLLVPILGVGIVLGFIAIRDGVPVGVVIFIGIFILLVMNGWYQLGRHVRRHREGIVRGFEALSRERAERDRALRTLRERYERDDKGMESRTHDELDQG